MSITGIALIIICVAFLILALTLIPAFLTVKMISVSIGLLSKVIQHELNHEIQELTAELTELKTIIRAVSKHAEDVTRFTTAIRETGNNLHTINHAIGEVTGFLITFALCTTGVKVAGKYMLERYQNNTGRNLIMSEEREISAGTMLVSFVAGAAIGAGLALLYAPKSGNEMRGTIADFAEDSASKIKEYTKKTKDKIKASIEDGKETIIGKKSILASAIEAGCKTLQEEKDSDMPI
jgi:gas vesicle protein/uncharacterized protein YoxC